MDPFSHLILPSLALMALGFDRKKVLTYAPLALFSDLMYFTPFHRNLSNSFIFLGIVSVILYKALKNKHDAKIAIFFLLSHPILDLGGYSAIFYPLLPHYFMLTSELVYNRFTGFLPRFSIDVATEIEYVYDSNLLTTNTLLLVSVLMVAILFAERQKIVKWIKTRLKL
jgi:hypothetical protein